MGTQAADCAALEMWTIYAHPADYPNGYIARKWVVAGVGVQAEPVATLDARHGPTLEAVRQGLPPGLHRIGRSTEDDPSIVETWI